MEGILQFVLRHSYPVLFLWVLTEQAGLPLPAAPVLLAAGALAGAKEMNMGWAVALATAASLLSDFAWYQTGRRRGSGVLNWLCRISLEPDSCVRRTEEIFARWGASSLLVAKFIPGLTTAAPSLAGVTHMRLSHFLLFETLGAMLWASTFVVLGFLFSSQLGLVAAYAARLGTGLLVLVLVGFAAYLGRKYYQRWRFIRKLRIARITPAELKRLLDAGEDIVVVDLRHRLDFEAEPWIIPGALALKPEELDERHEEIPRDREVVLYCT
jgi:membrane protein DedA with SNARE-associated domain